MTDLLAEFAPWLAGVVALVAAWFAARRSGRKEERNEQEKLDNENALDIRKRADDVERVRDDDLEFRD